MLTLFKTQKSSTSFDAHKNSKEMLQALIRFLLPTFSLALGESRPWRVTWGDRRSLRALQHNEIMVSLVS